MHIFSTLLSKAKEKTIGSADSGQRYDIPLHKDAGTGFLMLLVTLMVFLAFMASTIFFVLDGISERWTHGLENQITIEISAESPDGKVLNGDDIRAIEERIEESLKKDNVVKSIKILEAKDIEGLLSPWLDDATMLSTLPMPGLMTLVLSETDARTIEDLESRLKKIGKNIRIDTHQEWLRDILSLARGLQYAALTVLLVIGFITFSAIAGAVHARMQVHREDVELLHLIGAQDDYITKQFQRHIFILSLQASLIGLFLGGIVLLWLFFMLQNNHEFLLPHLKISAFSAVCLFLLPFLACVIATTTARFTVLKALGRMP